MGITRKMLSVTTFGLIDFRSDKERVASSSKKQVKAIKAQTKAIREGQAQRERV